MDPLTWTGALAPLNYAFLAAAALLLAAVLVNIVVSVVAPDNGPVTVNPDGTLAAQTGPAAQVKTVMRWSLYATILIILAYVLLGVALGTGAGILGGMSQQLWPVWLGLVVIFAASIRYKRKLGLYGKLFDSTVGMIGFGLVMFWVLVGFMAGPFDLLITHNELSQVSGMKNKLPGTPLRRPDEGEFVWYLLGGDNLARDVFSRLLKGAWVVVQIAPLATLFAFMVGITLGLPAGYYGGRLDTILSFLANLILAFPVIL
ncbi:MAG: ABC transporter permease, partial [Pseudomonadota bacterium]